jgi:enterochelin esterase-like enzyme
MPDLHFIDPFHADRLNNDRGIAVWLPPGYGSSKSRRYPVLYLQDGMWTLDCDTRHHETKAGVDSWVEKLSARGLMSEIILVAIDGAPDRNQEYSPAVHGIEYADFIVRQVRPYIDHHYRTIPEPAQTGIAGWSLGALISLYMAWKHPDIFGKAACLSTCFYDCPTEDDGDMVMRTYNDMIHASDFHPDLRLYLDYGSDEDVEDDISQPESIEQTQRLTKTLQGNLLIPNVDYVFHVEAGGKHRMEDWRRRFYRPLTFLYPAEKG